MVGHELVVQQRMLDVREPTLRRLRDVGLVSLEEAAVHPPMPVSMSQGVSSTKHGPGWSQETVHSGISIQTSMVEWEDGP